MPSANVDIRKLLQVEIDYYRAQNENLRIEIIGLEDTYNTNRERLGVIKDDFEESKAMIRKLRAITSG